MGTRKTVCFTGMDTADGERLKGLFAEANRRVGDAWTLAPENDAEMLIIDVDSLYGHMTWLKVHHSGRIIIALSESGKADADQVLLRPVTVESLAELLAQHAGVRVGAAPAATSPSRPTPVPSVARELPVAPPAPAVVEKPAPPATRPTEPAAKTENAPEAVVEPVAPARDPMLGDHLLTGALPGPVKLKLGDAPLLVLDPQSRTYLGPTALKGFLPYGKAVIRAEDWIAVTPSELDRLRAELGGAQPYIRLQWLAALLAGDGRIAPGYDQNQKFRLTKWPQIEREFPKHFRIATAMMKGPQLLTEIAEGSGATLAEVVDFVNASLATGFAETDTPVNSPDAAGNAQKGGLLGRLRGAR
jgi:hypothetical protein